MTNRTLSYLCLLLAGANAVLFFLALKYSRRRQRYVLHLLVQMALLILWSILYMLYYRADNESLAMHLYYARFFCVALLPPLYLFSSISYIHSQYQGWLSLYSKTLIIPLITCVIALYPPLRHLLISQSSFVQMQPLKELRISYGFWYWVHLFYSTASMLACTLLMLINILRQSVVTRAVYINLFLAPLLPLVYNVLLIFFRPYMPFSTTLGVSTISSFLLYWVAIQRGDTFYSTLVKDTAFEKLSSPAVILNPSGTIMECNKKAREAFQSFSGEYLGAGFESLLQAWITACDGDIEENSAGRILRVRTQDQDKWYRVLVEDSIDGRNQLAGTFIELRDITEEQRLIEKLYSYLNRDKLTGVSSYTYVDRMLGELDRAQYLPLAVVCADIDKLKPTNDTYGHKVGDSLIKCVADALLQCACEDWIVGRVGGDEFCVLIPNCSPQNVDAYLRDVHAICAGMRVGPGIVPMVSMGYAVKESVGQPMQEILKQADVKMYEQKSERAELRVLEPVARKVEG